MLEFNGNNMTLTRGDTIFIDTVVLTPLGLVYEVQEGDVLTFSVYDNNRNNSFISNEGFEPKPVIEKVFMDRKAKLESSDTAFLSKGKYSYKCVIEMGEERIKETYCEGDFILK